MHAFFHAKAGFSQGEGEGHKKHAMCTFYSARLCVKSDTLSVCYQTTLNAGSRLGDKGQGNDRYE